MNSNLKAFSLTVFSIQVNAGKTELDLEKGKQDPCPLEMTEQSHGILDAHGYPVSPSLIIV